MAGDASPTKAADGSVTNNGGLPPLHPQSPKLLNTEALSPVGKQRHNEWKVRPGYSSGASSYSGSDLDEDEFSADEKVKQSKSTILDLMTLKEEMKEKGDIASTVVRIEVGCFFIHFFASLII